MRRQFDGPGFGQTGQAPLRRCIVREAVHPPKARDGSIVNDHARTLLDHDGNDPPGDQPRAFEVDVEHRVPGFLGELV